MVHLKYLKHLIHGDLQLTQPTQIEVQGMEPEVNEKVAQALSIIYNLEVRDFDEKTLTDQLMILKLLEPLVSHAAIHSEDFAIKVKSSRRQHLAENPIPIKSLRQRLQDSGVNFDDFEWEESKTITKDQQLPKTDDSEEKIH